MTTPALFLALPGGTEIWVIGAIVLLIFGGRKLPELARSMGNSITQFKRGLKDDSEGEAPAESRSSARLEGKDKDES